MFQQMIVPMNIRSTRKIYATNEELIHDIGVAYQDVIRQFYDAGCRNLQLDDCTWGAIVGDAAKQRYQALGIDLDEVKQQLLDVNNLALEGRPEDMVITSHICRGNYHSTFFASRGAYDSVADLSCSHRRTWTRLFLEYDDERSGGFRAAGQGFAGQEGSPRPHHHQVPAVLEDKEAVIARIHEGGEVRSARPSVPQPAVRLCVL